MAVFGEGLLTKSMDVCAFQSPRVCMSNCKISERCVNDLPTFLNTVNSRFL